LESTDIPVPINIIYSILRFTHPAFSAEKEWGYSYSFTTKILKKFYEPIISLVIPYYS